jgi:hypothetical protein
LVTTKGQFVERKANFHNMAFVITTLDAGTLDIVSQGTAGYKTRELAEYMIGSRKPHWSKSYRYEVIFEKDACLLNCKQDLQKNVFRKGSLLLKKSSLQDGGLEGWCAHARTPGRDHRVVQSYGVSQVDNRMKCAKLPRAPADGERVLKLEEELAAASLLIEKLTAKIQQLEVRETSVAAAAQQRRTPLQVRARAVRSQDTTAVQQRRTPLQVRARAVRSQDTTAVQSDNPTPAHVGPDVEKEARATVPTQATASPEYKNVTQSMDTAFVAKIRSPRIQPLLSKHEQDEEDEVVRAIQKMAKEEEEAIEVANFDVDSVATKEEIRTLMREGADAPNATVHQKQRLSALQNDLRRMLDIRIKALANNPCLL